MAFVLVEKKVVAPDCKHFGTKVFEECGSSTRVGTAQCPDKCEQLDQPKWLRFLPADANDWWREDILELHQRPAMLSRGNVHKHSARSYVKQNVQTLANLLSTFTIQ